MTPSACPLLRATPRAERRARCFPRPPNSPTTRRELSLGSEGWRPGLRPGLLLPSSRASGHPTATCPLADRAQRGAWLTACLGQPTKSEASCQSSSRILLPWLFFPPSAHRQPGAEMVPASQAAHAGRQKRGNLTGAQWQVRGTRQTASWERAQ